MDRLRLLSVERLTDGFKMWQTQVCAANSPGERKKHASFSYKSVSVLGFFNLERMCCTDKLIG